VHDDYLRVAEAHPQSVAEVEDVSARVLRLQEAEEGCLLCLRGIERDQVVMDSRVLVIRWIQRMYWWWMGSKCRKW
jgi:hypothetical protein